MRSILKTVLKAHREQRLNDHLIEQQHSFQRALNRHVCEHARQDLEVNVQLQKELIDGLLHVLILPLLYEPLPILLTDALQVKRVALQCPMHLMLARLSPLHQEANRGYVAGSDYELSSLA